MFSLLNSKFFCTLFDDSIFGGKCNSLEIFPFLRSLFSTKDNKQILTEIVRTFKLLLSFSISLYCTFVYNCYTEFAAYFSVVIGIKLLFLYEKCLTLYRAIESKTLFNVLLVSREFRYISRSRKTIITIKRRSI